jgi:5-keto-L-gluconate epimerase
LKTAMVVSLAPTSFEALALSSDVEAAFQLVSDSGFDGIEIAVRDPAAVSVEKIISLSEKTRLDICAIGTGQAYVEEGLSLTSSDPEKRAGAMERMKKQIELSVTINARVIVGLIRGNVEKKEKIGPALDILKESLIELGDFAKTNNAPGLLLEPICRYETKLLNSVSETVDFLEDFSGLPIKILADTFHMNIEDRDMAESIRLAGDHIGHMHFADSNRWAPGQGHIDFIKILDTLKKMGYDGYLSAEILPEPSPEVSVKMSADFFKSTYNKYN